MIYMQYQEIQMINDCAFLNDPKDRDCYIFVSKMGQNVINRSEPKINPIIIGIHALRDIRKGEELYIHYGPDYWKNFY